MKKSKPSDLMRKSILRDYGGEKVEPPKGDMTLYLKIDGARKGAKIRYDGPQEYARFLAVAMGRSDVMFL